MPVERGLFVTQTGTAPNVQGTNPIQARLALAGLLAENASGTPRTGLLQPSTPLVVTGTADMSYNVAPINPVTNRAAAAGVYVYSTTGTTNVKTTAAPGANSRYDIIWTKQNDTQYGDSDTLAVVKVTQGTPSATPVKPSLPPEASGAIILAEALIQSGATATNSSAVQITQVWRYTALRGAPIPVRSQAERDELTPFSGVSVLRLDLAGAVETWIEGWVTSRTWVSPFLFAGGWSTDPSPSRGIICSSTQDGRIACQASFSIERTVAGFVQGPGPQIAHGTIIPAHLRPSRWIDAHAIINSPETGPQPGMATIRGDGQLMTVPLPGQSLNFATGTRINFTASWVAG